MILSVSRRTDIPQFYSDWFYERLKEGYLYVKNPMNSHQISRVDLSPEQVELIVFWTKNPEPMLKRIQELGEIPCYIQFTLTGYGRDIEPGVPDKRKMLEVFKQTAKKVGMDRLVWRYDPIFINERYPLEYHLKAFEEIARSLHGFTQKVVISFLDMYGKTVRNMKGIDVKDIKEAKMFEICKKLSEIADTYGLRIETCAEKVDFRLAGVRRGSCIDPVMVEQILNSTIQQRKDKNQRVECGCLESVEVGTYDTCLCGCRYCYANNSHAAIKKQRAQYDVNSPLLCGRIEDGARITERKTRSIFQKRG